MRGLRLGVVTLSALFTPPQSAPYLISSAFFSYFYTVEPVDPAPGFAGAVTPLVPVRRAHMHTRGHKNQRVTVYPAPL